MQEDLKQKKSQLDSKDLAYTKQTEELQSAHQNLKTSAQEVSKLRAELQKTNVTLSQQEQENQILETGNQKLSSANKQQKVQTSKLEKIIEGMLEREKKTNGKVLTQISQLEKQQKEIVTLKKRLKQMERRRLK